MTDERLREELAELAHEQWSGWMKYLFERGHWDDSGGFTINPESSARWKRQAQTPYAELSELERDSDRVEADKFFAVMLAYITLAAGGAG